MGLVFGCPIPKHEMKAWANSADTLYNPLPPLYLCKGLHRTIAKRAVFLGQTIASYDHEFIHPYCPKANS